MPTTTKRDLIEQVARATSISREAVRAAIQQFLNQIVEEVGKGNRLEFRDFGVFEVRMRGQRVVRNPRTQEPVISPPDRIVKFKAGRAMKKAIMEAARALQDAARPHDDADNGAVA